MYLARLVLSRRRPRSPQTIHAVHVILAFVGLVLTGTLACTEDDYADTSGPPNLDVYATAVCNYFARCRPAFVYEQFADVRLCASTLRGEAARRIDRPGVQITRRLLNACAVAIDASACDVDVDALGACSFAGAKANGAACASGFECASGGCRLEGACGTCAPLVGEGEECASAACRPGLSCSGGVCTRRGELGVACESVPCRAGLECHAGRCVLPMQRGGACASERPCSVAQGLRCVGGVCRARAAERGQACTDATCVRSRCDGARCVDFAIAGDRCEAAGDCAFPLDCTGGRCTPAAACP